MSNKWPPGVQRAEAFMQLAERFSRNPQDQELFRRFLTSVAFKGDLQYLRLSDVIESSFAGKEPGALVGLDPEGTQELTLINPEDQTTNQTFIDLIDTPPSYDGESGNYVTVASTEDALQFSTAPSSSQPLCVMTMGSTQSLTNDGQLKLLHMDTDRYDPEGWSDTSNYLISPDEEAHYLFGAHIWGYWTDNTPQYIQMEAMLEIRNASSTLIGIVSETKEMYLDQHYSGGAIGNQLQVRFTLAGISRTAVTSGSSIKAYLTAYTDATDTFTVWDNSDLWCQKVLP